MRAYFFSNVVLLRLVRSHEPPGMAGWVAERFPRGTSISPARASAMPETGPSTGARSIPSARIAALHRVPRLTPAPSFVPVLMASTPAPARPLRTVHSRPCAGRPARTLTGDCPPIVARARRRDGGRPPAVRERGEVVPRRE